MPPLYFLGLVDPIYYSHLCIYLWFAFTKLWRILFFFRSNKSYGAENLRREHLETFKGLLWSAKAKNIEAPPWPWSSDQGLAKVWPQWSAFLFLQSKYLQVLAGESRSYVAAGNSKNLLTCIWFGILKSAKSVSGVGANTTKRALGIHISW